MSASAAEPTCVPVFMARPATPPSSGPPAPVPPVRLPALMRRLRRRHRGPPGVALAIAAASIAFCARFLVLPEGDTRFPMFLGFPVTILCAALLGRWPAVAAAVTSAMLPAHYVMAPAGPWIGDPAEATVWAINLAVALALSVLVDWSVGYGLERERLHREFQHRVKNDLQVVNSLINLQARAADGATRAALEAAARCTIWVGHVHDSIGRAMPHPDHPVDSRAFLLDLADRLRSVVGVVERHDLPHTMAKPLGIALALLSAASTGGVAVEFRRRADDYVLNVETPEGEAPATYDRQVAGLARQLGGEMTCAPGDRGVTCSLRFPVSRATAKTGG